MSALETTAISQPASVGVRRGRGRPARDAAPVIDDEALLDAAFEAFSQRGYEGVAVRELGRRLGISHNLIRVRFGSKEDLWRRAVDTRMGKGAGEVWAAIEGSYPD